MWRLSSENAPQRPSRGSETQPEAAPPEPAPELREPPAWSAPEVPVAAENSVASLMDAPPPHAAASDEPAQVDLASGLVVRALAGDAAAFGDLIDRYERAALAVAYATTRDSALAADAVQEACLKAWNKRQSLADPERFAGWFLHIVRRCGLDQIRWRKPVQSLGAQEPGVAETHNAAGGLLQSEDRERVRAALEELDDESRLAVIMRYYDNSSAREIADVLACSPAAVDMRLKRARDKMREMLSDMNQ